MCDGPTRIELRVGCFGARRPLLFYTSFRLQPFPLPSGLSRERQLVSYRQSRRNTFSRSWLVRAGNDLFMMDSLSSARTSQTVGDWVWARQVASQSCLRRDEPDGGHLATKEMCRTTTRVSRTPVTHGSLAP